MSKRLVLGAALLLALAGGALTFLRNSDDPLQIQPIATVKAEDPNIGSLVIWDKYLAWMGIPDPSGKNSRILLHDLDTKKTKTMAKGLSAAGPAWVRGSKDVLVYMSFGRLPCDDLPDDKKKVENCSSQPRGWQMFSVDVRSGKKQEIAASKTEIDQRFPPLPELSWPYVVWTVPPAEISPKPVSRGIAIYDLKARKGKVIVSGAIVGRSTIEEETVVYTAAVPGVDRWDLFAANANGKGGMNRLTTSGKVIFPRSANGMVAWQEPVTANPNQAPTHLSPWARSISGKDRPARLAPKGSNPFPGNDFVVWISSPTEGGQLLARDPSSKKEPIVVEQQPAFAAGWWAFGDRLIWATTTQEDLKTTTMLHIVRVTR